MESREKNKTPTPIEDDEVLLDSASGTFNSISDRQKWSLLLLSPSTSEIAEINHFKEILKRLQNIWNQYHQVNKRINDHSKGIKTIRDPYVLQKLIQRKKDLLKALTVYDRTKLQLVNAGQQLLNNYGVEVTLLIIRDEEDRDRNAVVNFYDENGRSIFDQADARDIVALIVTTYEAEQPLAQYRDNNRFTILIELRCRVVFANWNGENVIIVVYTSGRYYIVNRNISLQRINFFEHIMCANAMINA
eukprot:scaffold1900_cov183-Ochromonas_danica.AAC.6